jgi:hypothetical protein
MFETHTHFLLLPIPEVIVADWERESNENQRSNIKMQSDNAKIKNGRGIWGKRHG